MQFEELFRGKLNHKHGNVEQIVEQIRVFDLFRFFSTGFSALREFAASLTMRRTQQRWSKPKETSRAVVNPSACLKSPSGVSSSNP
jgi:hypothetical protein